MRNLTHRTILAVLAIALAAVPLEAQSRGGGGGSRGGGSRGGGGSHHSSSMSSPSRGGSSSHGSSGRSSYSGGSSRQSYHHSSPSSSSSRSYSQPSHRSSSPSSSRSYSSPQRQGSAYGQQRRSVPQSGTSGSGVRQSQQYRQSPQAQSQRRVQPGYQPRQTPQGQAQQRRVQPQQQGSRQVRPQQGAQARMGQPGATQRSGQRMAGQPGARPSTRPLPGTARSFAGGAQPTRVHMNPAGPGHVDRIHPRHRAPMPFNRPARFWAHGPHYFGYRVGYLPARYELLHYWGRDYYFLDGLYYRHYLNHYYVCRPPFGVFFDPILDDIAFVACNFAYYASVYNAFRTINDNARTITEQNEIIAQNNATIAQQNADIALNSERAVAAQQTADNLGLVQSYADATVEYYYDDGVFFTKGKDGKYVTIVPPAGAIVKELPDDYETITMNGSEYYKVDDTVYRAAVVDGAACFEVLGQLTGALAEQFATQ